MKQKILDNVLIRVPIMFFSGKRISDKFYLFIYFLIKMFRKKHIFIHSTTVKSVNGILFYIPKKEILLFGSIYKYCENKVTKEIQKINVENCFIDCGANMGRYSLLLGKKYPKAKILSFEPDKLNFNLFLKNIEINNLKNISPINYALSDKNGKVKMYFGKGTQDHSIKKKVSEKYVIVETVKLDDIIKKRKIKKVDLMKIDVEGAELDVLRGAKEILKRDHPKIIFETWDDNYLIPIDNFLKKFGYNIKHLEGDNYFASVEEDEENKNGNA